MEGHNAGQDSDQPQMMRNEYLNQPSDIHSQGQAPNFLQETGAQAKNMAQNTMSMAKGAATGAANMAQGAASAVKNTLGMNSADTTTGSQPGRNAGMGGSANPSTRM